MSHSVRVCHQNMECKVWKEFQYTKKDGTILKFTVQDCPKERMDEVIDLYHKYFIRDELFQKLSGISKSKEATEECTILLEKMLMEEGIHITICIDNRTNAVVGVSSMKLTSDKLNLEITPKTKEVAKLFEMLHEKNKMYDFCSSYAVVDKYYAGRGIIVHPDYRGCGIARVFVESRKDVCKDHGVSVTSAWMTSISSQKAGDRAGWETAFEIDSHEYAKKFDAAPYDGIAPTFKLMVKKISG